MVHTTLNVSAYKFVAIEDPQGLRLGLLELARDCQLKGSILLASEGINLVLAGLESELDRFLQQLGSDSRFADLELKRSWSRAQPFGKLLVKVKREIIRMNEPAIRPADARAPVLDALTLSRWLDQGHDDAGRAIALLDTRNAFEVEQGSFEGALDWGLSKFSDFPSAFTQNAAQLEGKTVVSFCTGGIRCEKAAIYMRSAGLPHVYQLDGGILKYFEQAGGRHFRGECFVFDERTALDAALRPLNVPLPDTAPRGSGQDTQAPLPLAAA